MKEIGGEWGIGGRGCDKWGVGGEVYWGVWMKGVSEEVLRWEDMGEWDLGRKGNSEGEIWRMERVV